MTKKNSNYDKYEELLEDIKNIQTFLRILGSLNWRIDSDANKVKLVESFFEDYLCPQDIVDKWKEATP